MTSPGTYGSGQAFYLQVPPGSYLITAKISAEGGLNGAPAICNLTGASRSDRSYEAMTYLGGNNLPKTLNMQVTDTLVNSPVTTIVLQCAPGNYIVKEAQITALKVATATIKPDLRG
jgi:hypothetical protein